MTDSVNRIMVNTIVKKAIRDIKVDPERTVRNLVDMALRFADSRFQKQFYSDAQQILSNEKSGYYELVKNSITKVNEKTMLTFGMNLGYNGLYEGAQSIRTCEEKDGYHIPWSISLTISEGKVYDQHHAMIRQGETMGIHSWHLFSDHSIYECLALASRHPESAFVIFCGSHEINPLVLDYADGLHNFALIVPYDKDADIICQDLQSAGILYGIYYNYAEKDLPMIESGELLHDMEQLHPTLCIFKPQLPGQFSLRQRVYSWILKARTSQVFQTLPWELFEDMKLVDSIISDNPAWIGFDRYGQLNTDQGIDRINGRNIYTNDLSEILRQAFPLQKGTAKRET